MTLTVGELQLLLEALDMAISRRQSQADYYAARPQHHSRASVVKHEDAVDALHALALRFSNIRPRHDVLEVAGIFNLSPPQPVF